jgi:hypothetical protein
MLAGQPRRRRDLRGLADVVMEHAERVARIHALRDRIGEARAGWG